MNLLDIRKQFVKHTGRRDLVTDTTTYSDNGADFFINAGIRWLDRRTGKNFTRFQCRVDTGGYKVTFEDCLAVHSVWATSVHSGERSRLVRIPIEKFRETPIPKYDVGFPKYYCPVVVRTAPSIESYTSTSFPVDIEDVIWGKNYTFNGIVWVPPCDGSYVITVYGEFLSGALSSNSSYNYWTENHPEIVVLAASLVLEMFYRNTEGVRDAIESLMVMLSSIDISDAANDSYEKPHLEG